MYFKRLLGQKLSGKALLFTLAEFNQNLEKFFSKFTNNTRFVGASQKFHLQVFLVQNQTDKMYSVSEIKVLDNLCGPFCVLQKP